jgi:hypothetical protein
MLSLRGRVCARALFTRRVKKLLITTAEDDKEEILRRFDKDCKQKFSRAAAALSSTLQPLRTGRHGWP